MIVLHAIGGPVCVNGKPYFPPIQGSAGQWKGALEAERDKSIHYVIDRSGRTLASVPETQIAWHAKGANRTSIGIELVNTGDGIDPFPAGQIDALVALLKDIRTRWPAAVANIKRHADVDRGRRLPCGSARRVDPGEPSFPYDEVRRRVAE